MEAVSPPIDDDGTPKTVTQVETVPDESSPPETTADDAKRGAVEAEAVESEAAQDATEPIEILTEELAPAAETLTGEDGRAEFTISPDAPLGTDAPEESATTESNDESRDAEEGADAVVSEVVPAVEAEPAVLESKEDSPESADEEEPAKSVIVLPENPRIARLPLAKQTRIMAVTSGKGGVGKTNITCNLALAMSRMGKRVLVFDADLSLANVDILLGIHPRSNLSHVVRGEKSMKDILVEAQPGFFVVPGVSGIEELANLSTDAVDRLLEGFSSLEDVADVVLIDTAAGIHHLVMSFLLAADQVVLVTTPEPTAYMDAYALIKVLIGHDREKDIQLIVNMATNDAEGREVIRLLSSMCRQWLQIGFDTLGVIPRDVDVLQSVRRNAPVLAHSPHSAAAKRLRHIAATLLQGRRKETRGAGLRGFMSRVWSRCYVRRLDSSCVGLACGLGRYRGVHPAGWGISSLGGAGPITKTRPNTSTSYIKDSSGVTRMRPKRTVGMCVYHLPIKGTSPTA